MIRSSIETRRSCAAGHRRGGLLRALERRGDDDGDVAVGERVGGAHRHLLAELGEAEPGQSSVEDAGGVEDLAVPQQVDDGAGAHAYSFAMSGCADAAALAAAGRAATSRSSAVSSCAAGDEPGLVGARREVDALVEHGVEEGGVAQRLLGARLVVVAWGLRAEEHREQVAGGRQGVGHTLGASGPRTPAGRPSPRWRRGGRRPRGCRRAGWRGRTRRRPGFRRACPPGRPDRPGRGGP